MVHYKARLQVTACCLVLILLARGYWTVGQMDKAEEVLTEAISKSKQFLSPGHSLIETGAIDVQSNLVKSVLSNIVYHFS